MALFNFGTGAFTGMLYGWMSSMVFWGIILFIFIFLSFGLLIIRKRIRLRFPVLELIDLGNGKFATQLRKGGWFRSITMFFGLIDHKGEDIFRLKDGRIIANASSEDYHDIFNKKGFIVYRKGDDPKILIPINSLFLREKDKEMIMAIAPADYRDFSVSLVDRATKEMMGFMEKYGALVGIMVVCLILMISIIFILQYAKHSQDSAKDMILKAGQMIITKQTPASEAPIFLLPWFFRKKKVKKNGS